MEESEDREYDANMIIPGLLDLKTPLDPFIIRPWVKTDDPVAGTYYYNVETGRENIEVEGLSRPIANNFNVFAGESVWDEPDPAFQQKLNMLKRWVVEGEEE